MSKRQRSQEVQTWHGHLCIEFYVAQVNQISFEIKLTQTYNHVISFSMTGYMVRYSSPHSQGVSLIQYATVRIVFGFVFTYLKQKFGWFFMRMKRWFTCYFGWFIIDMSPSYSTCFRSALTFMQRSGSITVKSILIKFRFRSSGANPWMDP